MYKTNKLYLDGHDVVKNYHNRDKREFVNSSFYLLKKIVKIEDWMREYAHSYLYDSQATVDKLPRIHLPFELH